MDRRTEFVTPWAPHGAKNDELTAECFLTEEFHLNYRKRLKPFRIFCSQYIRNHLNGKERFLCPTVMITLVNLMLVSKYLTNLKRKCSFIVNLWPSVIYKFFLMPSGNGDVSYSLVTYESQARLLIITFFLFITFYFKFSLLNFITFY